MTATYVGSMSIGAAVPGAAAAASAGFDGITAATPDLNARVEALAASIAALATMPALPSFADMQLRAVTNLASIELAMATPGLPPPPSLATAIVALQALLDALAATALDLHVKAQALIAFQGFLAEAGVHVVAYDGAVGSLGSQLQAAVPIPSGHVNALALVTSSGAAWSAMSSVFRVTP